LNQILVLERKLKLETPLNLILYLEHVLNLEQKVVLRLK
jgi:hypothetical protein